jgi:xylulokinase
VVTDYSDASGTLLLDIRKRSWSGPVLDALDIDPRWLPPPVESTDVIGRLSTAASKETGLPAGIPVAGGGADNACGAVGMGVVEPGGVAVSIGSSGTVLAPIDSPTVDPGMRLHTFCHATPGRWYLMGVMLSAGLSLKWLRDVMNEPAGPTCDDPGALTYELMTAEAAQAPPGSGGLVFLPYMTGERTPHADPDARGVIFGLDLTKKRSHVIRAVMEGVVFGLNDSIEIMRELEIPLSSVVTGGGGSRSDLWCRIQADVFDLPLRVASRSDTAMLGAALIAGVASGGFGSLGEACESLAEDVNTLSPVADNHAVYRESYLLFKDIYPRVSDLFGRSQGQSVAG